MTTTTTTRQAIDFVTAPLIAELTPHWLLWLKVRRLSDRTIETYGKNLRVFVEFLGDAPTVADLTTNAIEDFMIARLDLATSSVIKHLTAARSFVRWAIRKGYCRADPFVDIDWPRKGLPLPRALTSDQLTALSAALAQPLPVLNSKIRRARQRYRRVVLLGLYAGLRRGEIVRLDWQHVDLDGRMLTILHSKWDESRTVPIHPRLAAELATTPAAERRGAVCGQRDGRPYNDEMVERAFADWLNLIPALTGVTCHTLRHTFATQLLESECDIRTIQTLLGHRDIRVTSRYLTVADTRRRAAVEKLPDWFGERRGAQPTPGTSFYCAQCGKPSTNHPNGRPRMYCHDRCKWSAYRARKKDRAREETSA